MVTNNEPAGLFKKPLQSRGKLHVRNISNFFKGHRKVQKFFGQNDAGLQEKFTLLPHFTY